MGMRRRSELGEPREATRYYFASTLVHENPSITGDNEIAKAVNDK